MNKSNVNSIWVVICPINFVTMFLHFVSDSVYFDKRFCTLKQNYRWKKSSSRLPLTRCTSGLEQLEQIPTVFNPRGGEQSMSFTNDSSDEEPTHCYWPPLNHPVPPCPPYSDFKAHLPQPPKKGGESSPASLSPALSSDDEHPPPYITVCKSHPQPDLVEPKRIVVSTTKSPETPEEPIFANVEIGLSPSKNTI